MGIFYDFFYKGICYLHVLHLTASLFMTSLIAACDSWLELYFCLVWGPLLHLPEQRDEWVQSRTLVLCGFGPGCCGRNRRR
jgi:hypothetical protein